MQRHLVTFIIPIYNVEKYLDRCIKSVLNQSYKNLEVILVDDGSLDNSPVMCDEFSENDQRIKVVHKDNGGLSDARNAGLEIAKGNYIIFLDSDDYVEEKMVEDAVNVLEKTNSDVVIWGFYSDYIDENEELISSNKNSCISASFSKNEFYEIPMTRELIGILGYAWNKMYKKNLLVQNNLNFTKGLSLVEDIVFNGPVLTKAEKITFIEESYVHYMQRPRKTLGAVFYEDYYYLKSISMNTVESMLKDWGKSSQEIIVVKSQIGYDALKSTVRLLSKVKKYNKEEKRNYLDLLLNNTDVKINLKEYSPENYKDKIIKYLMMKQYINLLLTLYSGKK